jgi:hypothetical protein
MAKLPWRGIVSLLDISYQDISARQEVCDNILQNYPKIYDNISSALDIYCFLGKIRENKGDSGVSRFSTIIRLCVCSKPPIIGFTFILPAKVAGPEAVCKRARLQDKPKKPCDQKWLAGLFSLRKLVIANCKMQIEQRELAANSPMTTDH